MTDDYQRSTAARRQTPTSPQVSEARRAHIEQDVLRGVELSNNYTREDVRGTFGITDEAVNAHEDETGAFGITSAAVYNGPSSDYSLPTSPMSPYFGFESSRFRNGAVSGCPLDNPYGSSTQEPDPLVNTQSPNMVVEHGRPEIPVLPDASSTLYVEGLPANCTKREVAHIFRHFMGYKDLRLVMTKPRYPGGDPLVFCLVDFLSATEASNAMDALQDYIFDECDSDSALSLQFAHDLGARSGDGH